MIEIKNLLGVVLYRGESAESLREAVIAATREGAYLIGANLSRANLSRAVLSRANLSGAVLSRADLSRAVLSDGVRLIGARPVVQVGPIGSRSDWLIAYLTDGGIRIDAGCQRQITRDEFEVRVAKTHGDNQHAREYRAALAYIDAHAAIWSDAA